MHALADLLICLHKFLLARENGIPFRALGSDMSPPCGTQYACGGNCYEYEEKPPEPPECRYAQE
jgi:hypothetical protein